VKDQAKPHDRGLEELYLRHAPEVTRLAFLITGDRQFAQDVVQDAFVRVAGRFRHLRFPDAFHSYLRRTVVNLCTSEFRRRRREWAYVAREIGRPEPTVLAPDFGSKDELRRALRQLPVRQRAAVVLRYYEHLSERDVAEALGCSVPAARSLVARAMETLRHEFQGVDE
jgi:RNA polymerase sigma-70 factor (sigma-E family)